MKKILCAILASAMIITTAAACGKSQSPTNGSEDAIVTTADNDPAAQEDMDKLNELYAEAESVVSDIKAALAGNDSFARIKRERVLRRQREKRRRGFVIKPEAVIKEHYRNVNVDGDKNGHRHHHKKTFQSVFEYKHKHENSRRAAEQAGKEQLGVAYGNGFFVAVLARFFLKTQHHYSVKVYGNEIHDGYNVNDRWHNYRL